MSLGDLVLTRLGFVNRSAQTVDASDTPGNLVSRQVNGITDTAPKFMTWLPGYRPHHIVVTAFKGAAGSADDADGIILAFDAATRVQGEAWATEINSSVEDAPYVMIPVGVPTHFNFFPLGDYDGLFSLTARGRTTTSLNLIVEAQS